MQYTIIIGIRLQILMINPCPDFAKGFKSEMFVPDSGSNNSKKRRVKKIFCPSFFCIQKCLKLKITGILFLNRKIFLPHIVSFTQKNCHYALRNMRLGSEIRENLFRIPVPDPQHCKQAPTVIETAPSDDQNLDADA
jgi:hypothetical protein